ncbi:alpha-protein kinase 2 isoform 1-T2 [Discoglossus pictus]
MPKTVFVCPLHKSRNIQKDICTTCIEEKLNQIQVEQLCKAKKEAILENVHPEKSSPVKCKKQDSLDDGYHSLGMSCDQHYFDDKYQKERGCIMMDSKKYMENMDDDAEFPKRDGLTNKMHLNKLDNTKTHQHKIKKNDGKLKTSNIKDMPTNLDMVNDKVCLANCEQTKTTGLSNNHTLDSLASDSKGKVINKNKMKQHLKGEPSKRKVLECPSQNKKNCTLNNDGDQLNITLENHQKSTCKKPLSYQNDKPKSAIKPELLVASTTFLDSKTTENGALSLNAMEHIPNSKEHICKNTGTIKTRASNIKEDLIKNGQCPASSVECKLSMSGSSHPGNLTNSHEKSVENKAAKKKLKVLGKEHNKISKCNEKEKLAGEEVLVMEEENNDRPERATVKDNKLGPRLLRSIEADMFPDNPGNMKLHCQFGEIHADSTVTWTKDSKLLARIHRSSKDDSPVSLAIVQTSKQDQGLYHCNLKNIYGKVSTEFLLTSEVLDPLTCYQDFEGGEEIEFNQLLFREDFISDMYFGGNIQGRIATEDLHFGEGVHRKAFRSKVMCGLLPVFNPGHLCVLKVHNAIAYGTKTNDELVQKNYKLAVQECHVQNTAREYAKIYAAEAEQLEDFGIVPEIIPVFLIHRPANNIPYATVEEELIGEFVKYSIRDGKEINFLRRDSEAGQKCCTFQHWVYEKTSGNLLVTDMQGVGMKLTDVGIATIAKGYKGFKGNCSVSFIDQFKALHLCNKYCEILGLKSLKPQKQKKPIASKEKVPPASPTTKKSKQLTKPKNKT